ncbi:MAG TPA: DUF4998 domain-containing protein [Sunxiuqinia sp.]|nr:DUF4998 domain-containing protein [Sunxiuqinia sp.]
MKKNNQKYMLIWVLGLVVLAMTFSGCSKMDDYKKYIEGGEISYTGKIEDVVAHPGHNRILLTGLLTSDPKITSVKIYWNSGFDSIVQPVQRTLGIDTVSVLLDNMEENVHSFAIYTADDFGHRSVPVNKSARVYGDRYIASLINRNLKDAQASSEGVKLTWGPSAYLKGFISTEVVYTNQEGQEVTYVQAGSSKVDTTYLTDFKVGSGVKYRSSYTPDSLSIDTFYTVFQNVKLPVNVTSTYIKNAGNPFTYSSWDGIRWGILADWTTNDAVKNANGYGGYDNTVEAMSFNAGYYGVPLGIDNGKIYQAFELPAGKYRFSVDMLPTGGADGTVYMAVNQGSDLVDFDKVDSDALSYADVNALQEMTFTLSEPTTVSIGFVCQINRMISRVNEVQLFKLP